MKKSGGRYYVSVRIKLVVGFTLLFSLVFAAAAFGIYRLETNDMLANIETEMMNTMLGALPGVSGDDLESLMAEGQVNAAGFSDDPRYLAQVTWFEQVHMLEPRAWLYTFIPGDTPDSVVYAADGWVRVDPNMAAGFREVSGNDESMLDCFKTQDAFLNPFTDKWGTWVSACAPIRNSSGEVVGAIGIDFEAVNVTALQQRILMNTAIVFAIGYALGIFLVYVISGLVSRPLLLLAGAAETVGEGRYAIDVSNIRTVVVADEIATLADKFAIMAAKVGEREALLVSEVQHLRIQIDEARRAQQVEEITDSDFFKDLRARAKDIRSRDPNPPANKKEKTDE